MRVQLDTDVPVFSVVLTPHHFHEHDEHVGYFSEHLAKKGAEAAVACTAMLRHPEGAARRRDAAPAGRGSTRSGSTARPQERCVVGWRSGGDLWVRGPARARLVLPAALEARPCNCVVTQLGLGLTLRQVGGVGGDLVGDHAVLDVLAVGGRPSAPRVLHNESIAVPACAMIAAPIAELTWSPPGATSVVRGPGVENGAPRHSWSCSRTRSAILCIGTWPGTLDHHLHAVRPSRLGEFTDGAQLGELRTVVGVGDRPRPQPASPGTTSRRSGPGWRRVRRSGCRAGTPSDGPGTRPR